MLSLAVGIGALGGSFHERGWVELAWASISVAAFLALWTLAGWLKSVALEVVKEGTRGIVQEFLGRGKKFSYDLGALVLLYVSETRGEREGKDIFEEYERSLEKARKIRRILKKITEDLGEEG